MTKGRWKPALKILDNKAIHINNEFISCEHHETSLVDELREIVVVSHHAHHM
jgi:hypothetical protein